MIRTGIDDTQGMTEGGKVHMDGCDDGILLAEEHIFRILTDHGDPGQIPGLEAAFFGGKKEHICKDNHLLLLFSLYSMCRKKKSPILA